MWPFKKSKKKPLPAFFILCILASPVFLTVNAAAAGTVTGDFLLINIQARETALGEIFSPFYARVGASTMNPACMQGIKNQYFLLSHYNSVFDSHYEQVQYAAPVDVSSCAGALLMYSANDSIYRTDASGEPVEKIENYDAVLGGVYSRAINDEYNIGASIKLVTSKLYNHSVWGVACNLGLLYRNFENRYTIGADIENLGISTAYGEDKSMYPILLRAGYGTEIYRYEEEYRISLFIEERVFLIEDEGTETSFGMEAAYKKFFVFRYGYIFGRSEGRVAVGAGIKLNDLYIDYAYQPFFISDNAHRVTLMIVF